MEACKELGVEYLTLYAFSSENWNRPAAEVTALMRLLERFLEEKAEDLMTQNVRAPGDRSSRTAAGENPRKLTRRSPAPPATPR